MNEIILVINDKPILELLVDQVLRNDVRCPLKKENKKE